MRLPMKNLKVSLPKAALITVLLCTSLQDQTTPAEACWAI